MRFNQSISNWTSSETPERLAPETMAGGVAVFDYNNDGKLDIFFTNGANIKTLKKDSPKYSNRLFENDGHGHFTDVTEKAGLAGIGYDTGVAIGDYDNDGYEDIFVAVVHRNTLYHNNGDGTFTDVTTKAGLDKPDPQYGPHPILRDPSCPLWLKLAESSSCRSEPCLNCRFAANALIE